MPGVKKADLYYAYGNDYPLIENKWLPDILDRFPDAEVLRLDATIDEFTASDIVSFYYAHSLFGKGRVVIVRNADSKRTEEILTAAQEISDCPLQGHAFILIGNSLNKTKKLGKLIASKFLVRELKLPEVTPFDLLDAITDRQVNRILIQAQKLQAAGYNPFALATMTANHLLFLKQLLESPKQPPSVLAKKLKQHPFKIKKGLKAQMHWKREQLDMAIAKWQQVLEGLRQHIADEETLVNMGLIGICLD